MAQEDKSGTDDTSGQSEYREDPQYKKEDWSGMKDLDDVDGESDNEEDSGESDDLDDLDDENEDEQDPSKLEETTNDKYKAMEQYVSKTRDEISDLKSQNQAIENALNPYGGIDKALNLVQYVSSDPDFAELIKKKSRGDSSIDESKMSPDAKEAMKIVRDVAKEVVREEITQLRQTTIDPHIKNVNDKNLDILATQMTDKFGDDWLEYADQMQEMAEDYSVSKRNSLDLEDVEGLYIRALNKAGKLDKFSTVKKQQKEQKKINKSTPRSKTTSVGSNKKDGKPTDLFDAASRAAKKLNIKF